jgi:hypothetical protein
LGRELLPHPEMKNSTQNNVNEKRIRSIKNPFENVIYQRNFRKFIYVDHLTAGNVSPKRCTSWVCPCVVRSWLLISNYQNSQADEYADAAFQQNIAYFLMV